MLARRPWRTRISFAATKVPNTYDADLLCSSFPDGGSFIVAIVTSSAGHYGCGVFIHSVRSRI